MLRRAKNLLPVTPGSFGGVFLAESSPPSPPQPVTKPLLLPAGGYVDTRRPAQRQVRPPHATRKRARLSRELACLV